MSRCRPDRAESAQEGLLGNYCKTLKMRRREIQRNLTMASNDTDMMLTNVPSMVWGLENLKKV